MKEGQYFRGIFDYNASVTSTAKEINVKLAIMGLINPGDNYGYYDNYFYYVKNGRLCSNIYQPSDKEEVSFEAFKAWALEGKEVQVNYEIY